MTQFCSLGIDVVQYQKAGPLLHLFVTIEVPIDQGIKAKNRRSVRRFFTAT
jgi:hypothetical protein